MQLAGLNYLYVPNADAVRTKSIFAPLCLGLGSFHKNLVKPDLFKTLRGLENVHTQEPQLLLGIVPRLHHPFTGYQDVSL